MNENRTSAGAHPRRWLDLAAALFLLATPAIAADSLVSYRMEGDTIPAPLGGLEGVADRGRKLIIARDPANCVLCHAVPDASVSASGNIGPSLADVGTRLSIPQLRLRVVDESRVVEQTIMPAYHRALGLAAVAPEYRSAPILSAQGIEDIVAYLATLK